MSKFKIALFISTLVVCFTLLYVLSTRTDPKHVLDKTYSLILGTELPSIQNVVSNDKTQSPITERTYTFEEMSRMHSDIMKQAKATVKPSHINQTCNTKNSIGNLGNLTQRMNLSDNDEVRLSQLLKPPKMHLSDGAKAALDYMRRQVPGNYDTILITGASENHFQESQAFLRVLHNQVFPILKNFTLLFYNLDLTRRQRAQLVKYCKCTVVDFPFHLFPPHFDRMTCYTWKPFIISAHLKQANVVSWMDSSVRFEGMKHQHFQKILQNTKEKGMQISGPSVKTPFHTQNSLYHWFGDEPCAYLGLDQFHSGLLFVGQNPFIEHVIMDLWLQCAWDESCMCPAHYDHHINVKNYYLNLKQDRIWLSKQGPAMYNLRHLYDQSAISIIIHKVFKKYYTWLQFYLHQVGITFRRHNTFQYFPELL